MFMTVGCLLKVSANLQQVKPAKQDINKKCKTKKNEARNVYAECGPRASHTLQHGHYMRIHPGMNIGLFIRESACKATCCLLSKGIFLLDILKFEVFKQLDPLRTKDLRMRCK